MRSVTQDWVQNLSLMQQTVLIELTRGPDNIPKYHPSKFLIRFVRRCFLVSALDGEVIDNPYDPRGGSFTGPSFQLHTNKADWDWTPQMYDCVSNYLKSVDEMPHHYHLHLMHGIEILGYKHPKEFIRDFWHLTYFRFVNDMHLNIETEEEMDERLGDNRENWLKHADPATQA